MAATAQSRQDSIAAHFRRSREILDRAASDGAMMQAMIRATDAMAAALRSGNKILIAGNGGSAADAQHIAGEFLSRLNFDRNPLPAIALTTDTSVLTAIGNDYGFEQVFERQVRGLAHKGDVLLAISTSGASANVVAAVHAARERDMRVVALTGKGGGRMAELLVEGDVHVCVPHARTARIQEIHLLAIHCMCDIIDHTLLGDDD
jgi:D-sedoheptulose 7-phosphate isomerase